MSVTVSIRKPAFFEHLSAVAFGKVFREHHVHADRQPAFLELFDQVGQKAAIRAVLDQHIEVGESLVIPSGAGASPR